MIDKQHTLDELSKRGYKAKIISSIIYIDEEVRNSRKVEQAIAEIGYRGSFGIRKENNGEIRQ